MLWIEKIHEDSSMDSDYVRCPSCKKGRLCDKPVGDKVIAISIRNTTLSNKSNRIILKCPKCSGKFLIHLSQDDELN